MAQTTKDIAAGFLKRLYQDKNPGAAYQEFVSEKYTQHNPLVPDGREPAIGFLTGFFGAHPQSSFNLRRLFVDGDHAIAHLHARLEPGQPGMAVVDIFRVENGKIVEHWDVIQPVPEQAANGNGMV